MEFFCHVVHDDHFLTICEQESRIWKLLRSESNHRKIENESIYDLKFDGPSHLIG